MKKPSKPVDRNTNKPLLLNPETEQQPIRIEADGSGIAHLEAAKDAIAEEVMTFCVRFTEGQSICSDRLEMAFDVQLVLAQMICIQTALWASLSVSFLVSSVLLNRPISDISIFEINTFLQDPIAAGFSMITAAVAVSVTGSLPPTFTGLKQGAYMCPGS